MREETDVEKTPAEILKEAEKLHNDLRNYGNLTTEQKPLVVSGIMLALREIDFVFMAAYMRAVEQDILDTTLKVFEGRI